VLLNAFSPVFFILRLLSNQNCKKSSFAECALESFFHCIYLSSFFQIKISTKISFADSALESFSLSVLSKKNTKASKVA